MRVTIQFGVLVTILIVMIGTFHAQPDPYPTLTALREVSIPPRDRVVLARQLLGITEIQPPPSSPVLYQIGDRKSFTVSDSTADQITIIEAELAAIGQHILIWVDTRAVYNAVELAALAESFDTFIYPKMGGLWGSEDNPGIDGDSRVYAVFAYGVGASVAAYVSSDHTYPSEVVSTSNEHEMFIYNLSAYESDLNSLSVQSTTAHEFQHMIRENLHANPDTWVNEGLSVFTEIYLGYPDSDSIVGTYLAVPFIQLNTWADEGPRAPHYGAAGAFFTYLYERHGLVAIQAVSRSQRDGLTAVDDALKSLGQPGVEEFFADFVVANIANAPKASDGRWGYRLINQGRAFHRVVNELPYSFSNRIHPYAVDYFAVNTTGKDSLNIRLDIPNATRVLPVNAPSGRFFWYSHRADNSATTLTRQFDLTGITSADLRYKLWYRFEDGWDYGYVMVSTDSQTWDILAAPDTTDYNPHKTAYGNGYTGASDGWIEQVVALDAYAGQPIWVRFASITDDAVTQPGMALDDIRLDAVGYGTDVEADEDGWLAEGWARIDNHLPLATYVQVVQLLSDGEIILTRHRLSEPSGQWDIALHPDRQRVFVAVSPVTPFTTEPVTYDLMLK